MPLPAIAERERCGLHVELAEAVLAELVAQSDAVAHALANVTRESYSAISLTSRGSPFYLVPRGDVQASALLTKQRDVLALQTASAGRELAEARQLERKAAARF